MSLCSRRRFLVFLFFLFVLVLCVLGSQECIAQGGGAPGDPVAVKKAALQKISDELFKNGGWWGPGHYFSPIKLPLYIVLFLFWVGNASWVNADQERLSRANREMFNLIYLLLYGVVGSAIFFIPLFWLAFSLTVLICFVPPLVYVVIRNRKLPPGDKVLTGEHLWFLFAVCMGKIGIKIKHGPRLSYQEGPPVELEPIGKDIDSKTLMARLLLARNAPGFNLLRENLYDAIQSRATAIRFELSPEQTKIWHQVDGVWLELVPVPRKLGYSREKDIYEEMQDAAKKLTGGNPDDRRSKQGGKFKAVVGNPKKKSKLRKFEVDYRSQGTPTGEAAMFQLHAQIVPFKTLDEIGIRTEMQSKILEQINGTNGFVLVSAPPAHGLRSTFTVLARSSDRFTKDIANVEDINDASEPIENVALGTYDSTKGETPVKPLADLLFRGIAVLFVRDLSSPEAVKTCCEYLSADTNHLLITMIRAKDGVETLKRFLSVDFPAQQTVPYINSVICQRLIRKLCPDCKEAYEPDPQELKQLRLTPNQAQQLFRKRTPLPNPHEEARRKICQKCHGVGYFGRTALFELLTVSDATKALLLAQVEPAAIRQHINKEGQQTFFHEGIRLLLKGETDVAELLRVLKM